MWKDFILLQNNDDVDSDIISPKIVFVHRQS